MEKDNSTNIELEEIQDDSSKNPEPDYKEMYIRSLADYQNMKTRTDKMIAQMDRSILSNVIKDIVAPLYNDVRRGVKNGVSGCELMMKNIEKSLKDYSISIIGDEIIGKEFDTDRMSAITSTVTDNIEQLNTVADVIYYGMVDDQTKKTIVFSNVIVYQNYGGE